MIGQRNGAAELVVVVGPGAAVGADFIGEPPAPDVIGPLLVDAAHQRARQGRAVAVGDPVGDPALGVADLGAGVFCIVLIAARSGCGEPVAGVVLVSPVCGGGGDAGSGALRHVAVGVVVDAAAAEAAQAVVRVVFGAEVQAVLQGGVVLAAGDAEAAGDFGGGVILVVNAADEPVVRGVILHLQQAVGGVVTELRVRAVGVTDAGQAGVVVVAVSGAASVPVGQALEQLAAVVVVADLAEDAVAGVGIGQCDEVAVGVIAVADGVAAAVGGRDDAFERVDGAGDGMVAVVDGAGAAADGFGERAGAVAGAVEVIVAKAADGVALGGWTPKWIVGEVGAVAARRGVLAMSPRSLYWVRLRYARGVCWATRRLTASYSWLKHWPRALMSWSRLPLAS